MELRFRSLRKLKKYIYLISPQKIGGARFYDELNQVLKTNKVKYFQLRLKKISTLNLIKISRKIKRITRKNNVKFLISFSYGRALQQSALRNWAKDIKDTISTQKIFNHRSKMNGLSTSAKWSMDLEQQITA